MNTAEIKFTSHNFDGSVRDHFVATPITPPTPKPDPAVAHHIVIVDRSGSMWGSMEAMREMVERVMVCEDFMNSKLKVSLLSYSSSGDYTVHFSRTAVADVMKPGSKEVEAIRRLRATAMTCASQALDAAVALIQPDETTAITLHTDGYFNDRSPGDEQRAIQKTIKVLATRPNVFVNTVAYGGYSDFKTLDSIASAMSGKCIMAETPRQVYDALHDTSALLAGRSLPAMHIEKGDADYQIAMNLSQRKVNGSASDLTIRGIGADDKMAIYRIRRVSEATFKKSKAVRVDGSADPAQLVPVYALTRALLADGRIRDAKALLVGTGNQALVRGHWRAVVVDDLAKWAAALDEWIADPAMVTTWGAPGVPGVTSQNPPTVVGLLQILGKHTGGFTVDIPEFLKHYTRRGLARLRGTWVEENGTKVFQKAKYDAKPCDEEERVTVGKFQVNNDRATIQMLCVRDAELIESGVKAIKSVAGVKLNGLKTYNNYTLVADGAVNAAVLPIRISSQALHKELSVAGYIKGNFDWDKRFDIALSELLPIPLTLEAKEPSATDIRTLYIQMAREAMLRAALGEPAAADQWTPEQIAELKQYHLSPALYFTPPTTTPYVDQASAISNGEIDSRTVYKVNLGCAAAVSPSALYSPNAYLERRFSVFVDDAKDEEKAKDGSLKKPKFADLKRPGAKIQAKELSARTKLNKIDDIQYPLMARFLGVEGTDPECNWQSDRKTLLAHLHNTEQSVDLIQQYVQPLIFVIGTFGDIPESWTGYERMTAEDLEKAFEGIDIEKSQRDGTFFVKGRGPSAVIIGVCPENSWYSTQKGLEAIKPLRATA